MSYFSDELLKLLQYLTPGFVVIKILKSLLPCEDKKEYILIIEALIYTAVINLLVELLKDISTWIGLNYFSIGNWNNTLAFLFSILFSILIALLFSYILNNDVVHDYLRKKRITRETSYIMGWYGAFSEHDTFVVLHLHDERRVMGWPTEWPTSPKSGYFQLNNACWIKDDNEVVDLPTVDTILISAVEVKLVEFMKEETE